MYYIDIQTDRVDVTDKMKYILMKYTMKYEIMKYTTQSDVSKNVNTLFNCVRYVKEYII